MRDFDDKLLEAIKKRQSALEDKLARVDDLSRDYFYRYYHGSFKVYALQSLTKEVVEMFNEIGEEVAEFYHRGELQLNRQFLAILEQGTGNKWEMEHNQRWDEVTRPIVEAFFHARFFLQLMCKYGKELDEAPQCLPGGWAAVLYLYRAR